ncbi:MAG TPA: prolyl oligopeptidase family serine peptidase [Actinomycetes bacterium]|jgi:dipeptidyl aminopeptidase/acylaminoacyl peptidase|nr:prolyl oligopeptidase family serine peptidase [Actinomycetes bacterium]
MSSLFEFDAIEGIALDPEGRRLAHIDDRDGRMALRVTPLDGGPSVRWDAQARASRCYWRPDGERVLVLADPDGAENYQLAEVDPATGATAWLTRELTVRHQIGIPYGAGTQPYSPDSRLLAYGSNARDRRYFDVVVHDLASGAVRTVMTAEDRWLPMLWSPDGRELLVLRLHQNIQSDLFVCNVADGSVRHVTPHEGDAKYVPVAWSPDGAGCHVLTSQAREHVGLAWLDVTTPTRLRWLATADRDLTGAAVSADRRRLVWMVSHDGYSEVHVRDLPSGHERVLRSLPAGNVAMERGLFGFAPNVSADGRRMAVQVGRATAPTEVYLVDLDADTARPLTRSGTRVPPPERLIEPEVVSISSTDGVVVPALLFRPGDADAAHRVPLVVSIHGGPEVQAVPDFGLFGLYGAVQRLLAHGIGVLVPNIRGSAGYGMTHQRLIYRDWGGGDVRDLASCVAFAQALDWVDASRLGVCGYSYGGFAALSCLARIDASWAAGVAIAAPADLLDNVRHMPPHWQRRVRDWIGDPVADADLLRERSPLTHAESIQAPLLIVQSANDSRVAAASADRLVARLRALGRAVEVARLDGEGHSVGSRAQRIRIASLVSDWLLRHLNGA